MKHFLFVMALACMISCENGASKSSPDDKVTPITSDSATQPGGNGTPPSPDTSSKKGY